MLILITEYYTSFKKQNSYACWSLILNIFFLGARHVLSGSLVSVLGIVFVNASYHFVCVLWYSDAGRWKTLGVPVVIGGDNLPSPVQIGLTDLTNIGGASGPPGHPGSGTTGLKINYLVSIFVHFSFRCNHFSSCLFHSSGPEMTGKVIIYIFTKELRQLNLIPIINSSFNWNDGPKSTDYNFIFLSYFVPSSPILSFLVEILKNSAAICFFDKIPMKKVNMH